MEEEAEKEAEKEEEEEEEEGGRSGSTEPPGSPATRLHTVCRGLTGDRATTMSPMASWPRRTGPGARRTTSPRAWRVGSMEGPTH